MLRRKFNKFEPVSPRILRVEPARVRKVVILDDLYTPVRQRLAQFVQIENRKGRVRFLGCLKIPFDADVHLLRAALEPTTSARSQDRRLLDLFHTQDRAIEISRCRFASLGRRDLNVIDSRYA